MSPGSYAAGAAEIFQEGLRLPPVKLFDKGARNDALWAVIGHNVRETDTVMGDLQSQIASLDIGVQAISRLVVKYGAAALLTACRAFLDASEITMRARIDRMPDGVYEHEDFLDDDGIDADKPVRIHARVTIAGERMTVFRSRA